MRKKHTSPFFNLQENDIMKLNEIWHTYKTQNPKQK